MDSFDSFNPPKAHTIEIHLQAFLFEVFGITFGRIVDINKLPTAGSANVFCLPRRFPFFLISVALQYGHCIVLDLNSSLYYATPFVCFKFIDSFRISCILIYSDNPWNLSVLSHQCLERRIPDKQTLQLEIAAWEERRNDQASTVDWRFTTADARIKLKRLYPSIPN
jgi:hypothetical protein